MKPQTIKRKMISTTIRENLWRAIQMRAIDEGVNVNDILERLIEFYLRWSELIKLYSPGDKRAPGLKDEQMVVFSLAFKRLRDESKRRTITPEEGAHLGRWLIGMSWGLVNPDMPYDCEIAWKQWDGVNPPVPRTPKEFADAGGSTAEAFMRSIKAHQRRRRSRKNANRPRAKIRKN